MVRPDNKADNTNSNHRIGHAEIAKDGLTAKGCDNLADNAKGWQDHDVHFGVTKEPEQMLIQDRITACGCVKESTAKVTVNQQHGDCRRQHWQSEQ